MHEDSTELEIAWAAGLFEGEGWIGPTTKTGVQMVVEMKDRDVIERFARICGCGKVYVYPPKQPQHSQTYRWIASRKTAVEPVLWTFLPYLGERRHARAVEMLERLARNPGRKVVPDGC